MLLICGVAPAFLSFSFIYHSTRGRILSANVPPSPDVSHLEFCSTDIPPSPDVSHPKFCPPTSHLLRMSHIQNSVRQCPTFSRYLTSEILSGRRPTFSECLTFGILFADIPPSPDVSHPEFCPPTSHLLRMSYIRNSVRPTSHLLRIHFRPQSSAPLDFNRYE